MRRMTLLVPTGLCLALMAGCAGNDSKTGSEPAAGGAAPANSSGSEAGSGTQADPGAADSAESGGGSGSR